jgi:hypothetical protein
MLQLTPQSRIFVALEPVDCRKGIDGLAAVCRQALGENPLGGAVYSELGQAAEARAEAAEVLRLNPNFSLEIHKQRVPIKDPALMERHLEALRKAGLK